MAHCHCGEVLGLACAWLCQAYRGAWPELLRDRYTFPAFAFEGFPLLHVALPGPLLLGRRNPARLLFSPANNPAREAGPNDW